MLPAISQTSPRNVHPGTKVKVKLIEQLLDKHTCIVCSGILRNPVRFTACGHKCCLTCLADLLIKTPECPIDKTPLDKKKVTLDNRARKEVGILPIYCTNDTNGCKWRGTYSNLVSHLTECDYAIVSCPNKGCSEIMERKCVENHARDDCPKYIVSCPHCQRHVRREEERKHMHSCHKRPVSCPNTCGQPDMLAAQLPKHLEDECPKEVLPCPFVEAGCEFRNVRHVIRAHVTEKSDTHLNMVVDKIVTYRKSLLLHNDVIDDQKQRLVDVESRVYALEKQHGVQLLWKIDNYVEQLELAKNGKVPTVFSPPFLSNKHGYRMIMSANLYGGGKVFCPT
ncbi:hypothetical protein LSAT2_001469 [Lamellibrachia satsuma]|nr:hypothetical protein LSAT2_001469 [Lamellibrachia satsuma]